MGLINSGIFSCTYYVSCPFTKEECLEYIKTQQNEDMDWFKKEIIKTYSEFCNGKLNVFYNSF